jgi:hypothetical protein
VQVRGHSVSQHFNRHGDSLDLYAAAKAFLTMKTTEELLNVLCSYLMPNDGDLSDYDFLEAIVDRIEVDLVEIDDRVEEDRMLIEELGENK